MTPNEIKRLRGSLGLTQLQFAQMMNVHQGTVCRWERGSKKPDAWTSALLGHAKDTLARVAYAPALPDAVLGFLGRGQPAGAFVVMLGGRWAATNAVGYVSRKRRRQK